jgi:hypothetical protein
MSNRKQILIDRTTSFHFEDFYIDLASSDQEYLYVDVDGFTVAMKREVEGIVVDIFPLHVVDEAIASTYAFHQEKLVT